MKAILATLLLAGAAAAAQEQDKVKVEFEDVDLEALAQQVERVTKKTFVFPQALFQGRKVTLRSEKPITPDEFYRVFQSVCLMHGFALVPSPEENIHLVKIVPAAQAAKEPGAQPVLARGQPLPPGEGTIFFVLTPKHVTGQRATTVVQPALSPSGQLVNIPNTDLVLVIDASSAIQRAEKLLALVDVPGDPILAVPIVLQQLAAAQAKTQVTEFVQAFERVATGEQGRSRLEVLADERLNQVHLVGREPDVKRAQEYLAQLDRQIPAVQRTIGYYRLRNVAVQDIADSVRQFLGLAVAAKESARRSGQGKGAGPLQGTPVRDLAGAPQFPAGVTPPAPPGGVPREEGAEGQDPLPGGGGRSGEGPLGPAFPRDWTSRGRRRASTGRTRRRGGRCTGRSTGRRRARRCRGPGPGASPG